MGCRPRRREGSQQSSPPLPHTHTTQHNTTQTPHHNHTHEHTPTQRHATKGKAHGDHGAECDPACKPTERHGAAHRDVQLRGVTPDQTIATKVDTEKPKPRKNIAKNGRALTRTSLDTVSQCPKAKTRQRHRPTTAKRQKPVTIWRPQVHSRRAAALSEIFCRRKGIKLLKFAVPGNLMQQKNILLRDGNKHKSRYPPTPD